MNRRIALLTACAALVLTVAAAADTPKPTTTGPYFGKPAWLKALAPKKPVEAAVAAPSRDPAAEAQAERATAEANLYRRMAVCDKFRIIASANNDEAMHRMIERYEQEAFELYNQATAHLPASRATPGEDRLDRQLRSTRPTAELAERLAPATDAANRGATASNTRGGIR